MVPWLFVRRYLFYSVSLGENAPSPPPVRAPLQLRLELLDEGGIPELVSVRPSFYSPSLLEKRMSKGHFCFVGRSGSRLIHVRWIFRTSVYLPYLRRTLVLSPDEAYSDDAYTVPEYRRMGIYSFANFLLRKRLREMGYARYAYAYASWQAMAGEHRDRIWAPPVGEVKIIKFPWKNKYVWRGAVQELGAGQISLRKE